MNRFLLVLLVSSIGCLASLCRAAGGGADYGRGPETDPIAMAAIANMVVSNTAGTNISAVVTIATGNVATLQGQMTTATGNVATLQGQMTTATGNVATLQGQMTTATGNVATLQGQIVAQADTNTTTTATTHTPRFVGDVLIGGAGAGTNAVWISKGATSNDWIAIKP